MKKTTGTILLVISNILSTGTLIVISYGLIRLSAIEIEGAPPSYAGAIQIILLILLFELVKWFSFYQIIYKNKTFYLIPYLLLSIFLATAGLKQVPAFILGILYFISIVLLFFSTKDIQTKSEPTKLREHSETEETPKSNLEKIGFFLLLMITLYDGVGLVNSLFLIDSNLMHQSMLLVQFILVPLIVMIVSFYALVKIWKNRYSPWKYLFLALALFYGLSIVRMWFIGIETGTSITETTSNPIAIFIVTQVIVVVIYLVGFILLNRETPRK